MIRIHRIGLVAVIVLGVLFGALSRQAVADDVETRIAAFWARVNAMQPTDYLAAGDVGQWALNLIGREPRARLTVGDFRVLSAEMQAAIDHAGLAPTGVAIPSPTATASPVPLIAVVSTSTSFNVFGWYEVVGEVRNGTAFTARFVEVVATFYDANGTVIDTTSTYTQPSDLPAGAVAPFKLWSTKGQAVARYKLVVTTH